MEFEILERKFKFFDGELFSLHKRGRSQTEKWYLVKLSLDNGYKKFCVTVKGKSKTFLFHRVVYYAHNPDWNLFDGSMDNLIDHIDGNKTNNCIFFNFDSLCQFPKTSLNKLANCLHIEPEILLKSEALIKNVKSHDIELDSINNQLIHKANELQNKLLLLSIN